MNKCTLVTIPVYNEYKFLSKITSGIHKLGYDYVVIDDGSNTKTKETIANHSLIHITHDQNKGQGAALRTGFQYAIENNYDFVVHFDGDGQHRLEDIQEILNPLLSENMDIVFGSRFLVRRNAKAIPFTKRTILRIARIFEGLRSGLWLSDAHCGIRGLKVNSCIQMNFRSDRMAHASEIISETKRLNLKYVEVPVLVNYDNSKKSNISSRITSVLRELYFSK